MRDLLCLLEHSLEELWTAEGSLPRRLLQREHRRSQLVTEPGQQIGAMVVGQLLAELDAAPGQAKARALRPADKPAVERKRLPRPAGRREIDVGGTMAPVVRDRLHPASHPDPGRTGSRGTPSCSYWHDGASLFALDLIT